MRNLLFQAAHMLAENELLARAYLIDNGHDFGPNLRELSLKIE